MPALVWGVLLAPSCAHGINRLPSSVCRTIRAVWGCGSSPFTKDAHYEGLSKHRFYGETPRFLCYNQIEGPC